MYYRMTMVAALAGLTLGCTQQPAPQPSASSSPMAAITPRPAAPDWSPQVKAQAEALVAARKDGKFDYKSLSLKENGPAFVYLASTSDDPQVVSGALQGIEKIYSANKASDHYLLADEKVDQAILKALNSSDKSILYYGLRAAGDALGKEPNKDVEAKLVVIAGTSPELGARLEAVDALSRADGFDSDPAILDVYIKAMNDEAPVASTALFRRTFSMGRAPQAEELKKTAVALLKHKDPGVRGRAADFVAELYSSDPDFIIATIGPMTKDKDPFVRSSAAGALARSRDMRAVDLLIDLVDDKKKNTYDIKYPNLLGKMETVHHDGSAWSRVDDAALYALKSLTYSLGEGKRFVYDKIDYKKVDADIAAAAKRAKAWYQEFKKTAKK